MLTLEKKRWYFYLHFLELGLPHSDHRLRTKSPPPPWTLSCIPPCSWLHWFWALNFLKGLWVRLDFKQQYFHILSGIYRYSGRNIQGHSERMRKVKWLWKSQFLNKLSFLSCFRSGISDKFIPFRIQAHHNHPEASSEAGASNVLSGSGWLLEANHWLWDSEQRPQMNVSLCEGQN